MDVQNICSLIWLPNLWKCFLFMWKINNYVENETFLWKKGFAPKSLIRLTLTYPHEITLKRELGSHDYNFRLNFNVVTICYI